MEAISHTGDGDVGEPIPPLTEHAVSVSLPTWKANVGYEEGQEWVVSRMKTGYPRFFVHLSIEKLANAVLHKYGRPELKVLLFSSSTYASQFRDFCVKFSKTGLRPEQVIIRTLTAETLRQQASPGEAEVSPSIHACMFPNDHYKIARQFWQHTGAGISSRRAEYFYALFHANQLKCEEIQNGAPPRGPKRYQCKGTTKVVSQVDSPQENESADPNTFIEERWGRNLELSLAAQAKSAIRRRIAETLSAEQRDNAQSSEDASGVSLSYEAIRETDVYLYPGGMNAIYSAHRCLMAARPEIASKTVSYGFPYVDTLKLLQKWGDGCLFYGHGSSDELADLESRLASGEKVLALYCEFPGNPLLASPDLHRIRDLANRYDFAIVVDETIGNFVNVNVLKYADIVVSSLTKIFSGDCNVMGGSLVLNPAGRYFDRLKQTMNDTYQDNYWPEDAIFMERNSRDFMERGQRINVNAEAICDLLLGSPLVKKVYYPKHSPTKKFYERCKTAAGGYGGLLSVTFHRKEDAVAFFDNIALSKGPSLGTNFTLCSPYVLLAHYNELPWAASFGVEADLVRFSVGLEDTKELLAIIEAALPPVSACPGATA